eukprot:gene55675-76309_t
MRAGACASHQWLLHYPPNPFGLSLSKPQVQPLDKLGANGEGLAGARAELPVPRIVKRRPFGRRPVLLAKAELRDDGGIALAVLVTEVIEQATTLVDEHQQTAARMVVLRVGLEMFGEVADALGEDRDLYFGRTRIAF